MDPYHWSTLDTQDNPASDHDPDAWRNWNDSQRAEVRILLSKLCMELNLPKEIGVTIEKMAYYRRSDQVCYNFCDKGTCEHQLSYEDVFPPGPAGERTMNWWDPPIENVVQDLASTKGNPYVIALEVDTAKAAAMLRAYMDDMEADPDQLEHNFHLPQGSQNWILAGCDGVDVCVAARGPNGSVVAVMALRREGRHFEVRVAHVMPAQRRQGTGQAMWQLLRVHLSGLACARGVRGVRVSVTSACGMARAAHGFWHGTLGWQADGDAAVFGPRKDDAKPWPAGYYAWSIQVGQRA